MYMSTTPHEALSNSLQENIILLNLDKPFVQNTHNSLLKHALTSASYY